MKNNYEMFKGNKKFQTEASRKMCETMTFIDSLDFNMNEQFAQMIIDKHTQQCLTDYANYVNYNKKINIDEFMLYLTRFFGMYTFAYEVSNTDVKEIMYNHLHVQNILKALDCESIQFQNFNGSMKVTCYANGKFFKVNRK